MKAIIFNIKAHLERPKSVWDYLPTDWTLFTL